VGRGGIILSQADPHNGQPTVTVRALVVGLGSIGQRHARNLRFLLGDELVLSALRSRRSGFVVTDDLSRSEVTPEADCNGGVFYDMNEALGQGPDVVIISNPSSLHLDHANAAMRAGAAVFVEKPISDDLDGLPELERLVRESNGVLAVGCQLRFHPALLQLHQLLDEGVLGRLIAVHVEQGEYLPSYHPYEDYRQSYAARRELGGGVVLTQIHELDYIHWLFGMPSSVFAVGGTIGDLEIDVEDSASALFLHEVNEEPLAVHLHLDYLQQPPRRTCRVTGERGTVAIDLRAPSLTWIDNEGSIVLFDDYPQFSRASLFVDELQHFLSAVRREEEVSVDLAHATGTLRMALAMKESLVTGELQALGPVRAGSDDRG
jgi:predicted dehydrogenase